MFSHFFRTVPFNLCFLPVCRHIRQFPFDLLHFTVHRLERDGPIVMDLGDSLSVGAW